MTRMQSNVHDRKGLNPIQFFITSSLPPGWGGFMRAFATLSLGLALGLGCAAKPPLAGKVGGVLDGFVYMTAPLGGATVAAYQYDPDSGRRGDPIGEPDTTTA